MKNTWSRTAISMRAALNAPSSSFSIVNRYAKNDHNYICGIYSAHPAHIWYFYHILWIISTAAVSTGNFDPAENFLWAEDENDRTIRRSVRWGKELKNGIKVFIEDEIFSYANLFDC